MSFFKIVTRKKLHKTILNEQKIMFNLYLTVLKEIQLQQERLSALWLHLLPIKAIATYMSIIKVIKVEHTLTIFKDCGECLSHVQFMFSVRKDSVCLEIPFNTSTQPHKPHLRWVSLGPCSPERVHRPPSISSAICPQTKLSA